MRRETHLNPWASIVARAATAYIAGPALSDALATLCELNRNGFAGTIGYWNADHDHPRSVAAQALRALDALADPLFDATLSIKAAALGFDSGLLDGILERARRNRIHVHFDALGPETADRTLALIASSRSRQPDIGCTLPGRWRRSIEDAETAVALGVSVRVVKGQWADASASPIDPSTGFLDVIDRLTGRAKQVAVATHDRSLAREALARLGASRTPCEVEVLLGFETAPVLREAAAAGVPVRFYVPYGSACLPYSLSQAARDPRLLHRLFKDVVYGRPELPHGTLGWSG